MADLKKLISLQNLTDYDELIKSVIETGDAAVDAKSIKTVLWDSINEKIKFFKKENATLSDTADYEVAISSSDVSNLKTRVGMDSTLNAYQTKTNVTDIVNVLTASDTTDGSVAKAVKDAVEALDAEKSQTAGDDGLALSITQVDGKITAISGSIAAETYDEFGAAQAVADTLADVATSGAAVDVTVADEAGKLTTTNVEGALLEIVNKADANATAITTLNSADTVDGSVAKSIKTAIANLDAEDTAVAGQFVTAVSEEDGVITVSRAALTADDIPTLTVAKLSDAGTAAKANVATVAIGGEGEVTTALPTVGQVKTYVTEEIADLEGAMHFVGVITRNEGETDEQAIARVVTAPKPGDVVVMADNAKEYIFVDPDPETEGDEVWREVGDEGLYVKKSTTIAGVDLEDNITKDELLTALNVADGAQVNVLEGVQVNGVSLDIDDKKVNIEIGTGSSDGNISVNGYDVAVKGLGSAAYTEASAYDAAGTAQGLVDDLDATISTVTESDPTPVLNISITEEDGKLTDITASVKAETFDAYGSAAAVQTDLDGYKYEVAAKSEIEALFADAE